MNWKNEPHPHGAEAGFTLIEIMVASFVTLASLAAITAFNRAQLFGLTNQAAQLDVQTVGRNFLDLFVREVRRSGMDPTCAKNFEAIAEARPDRLRFLSDLNGNGLIDGPAEDVTYAYNYTDRTVDRTAGTVTDTLLSGIAITGSTLRYYDGGGGLLSPIGIPPALTATQRASVRRVQIVLTLQAPNTTPQNDLPFSASFSSNVDLRNRFFLSSTACS